MPSFQELFEESQGQPITYQGRTLVMADDFPVAENEILHLHFESTRSEWRQGVYLTVERGAIRVNEHDCQDGALLWYDTAPATVRLQVTGRARSIEVRNTWDSGNGVVDSWHHGAAMIVEEMTNGRRYLCNDGHPDDDFDDIVFSIIRS